VAEAGGLGVMSQGLNALSANPAGLADASGGEAQLSHSNWAADIRVENLGAAVQSPYGALALAGTWVDFGGIQGYNVNQAGGLDATQTLHPNAGSIQAAWAAPALHQGLRFGVALSVVSQSLDGQKSALAPAADAGLKADLGLGFTAAASLLHAGGQLDGSELPTQARVGLAWAHEGFPVELGVELGGLRGAANPDIHSALRARLAHGLNAHLGWEQLSGAAAEASAGLSFQVTQRWDLDYAFRQQADLGATHHVGLSLHWD
jgi:hypothetical protein